MPGLYSGKAKALADNHAMREVKVSMNKFFFINSEVILSSTLEIRGLKPNSPAIHYLLIGDKIISINGQLINDPTEALLLIHKAPRVHKNFNSLEEGFQEFQIEFGIYRQLNKAPVNRLRLAYAFKQSPRSLSHPAGFHYFIVTLRRIRGVHLGFKVKENGKKLIITEIFPGSIASFNYSVGDALLDVNCEPVDNVRRMREILKKSMHRYDSCTTLLERLLPEPIETKPNNVDPKMAKDVASIGEREAYKYFTNIDRHFLRPVLLSRDDNMENKYRLSSERFKESVKQRKQRKGFFNTVFAANRVPTTQTKSPLINDMLAKKGTLSREKKAMATAAPLIKKLVQKLSEKTEETQPMEKTAPKTPKKSKDSETSREKETGRKEKDVNANVVRTNTMETIRIGFGKDKNMNDSDVDANQTNQKRSGTPPRKFKRRTIISPRHGEHEISTDVEDPRQLHKVKEQRSKSSKKKVRSPKTDIKKFTPPASPTVLPPLM